MNNITTYTPTINTITLEDLKSKTQKYAYKQSFSSISIAFLNEVSRLILQDPELKTIPEYASLAFWLRKSNLIKMIEAYNNHTYFPLGTVFHICPNNVETMFLYSLSLSILAGNTNLVRISSTNKNNQIIEIFNILNLVLKKPEFENFKDSIFVFTYDRDDEINKTLSSISDSRVIWGGDKTIQMFKGIPTMPHCKDILFPNRNSLMIFSIDYWLNLDLSEKEKISKLIYNDIFTFNQKACSSPSLVLFYSKTRSALSYEIIPDLTRFIEKHHKINTQTDEYNLITLKLNQLFDDVINNKIINSTAPESNSIIFSEIYENNFPKTESCGGGYLYFKDFSDLNKLSNYIDATTQTLSYLGLSKIELDEIVKISNSVGIDRIIPVGDALKFNNIWDGKDLLLELVKIKYIQYSNY